MGPLCLAASSIKNFRSANNLEFQLAKTACLENWIALYTDTDTSLRQGLAFMFRTVKERRDTSQVHRLVTIEVVSLAKKGFAISAVSSGQ